MTKFWTDDFTRKIVLQVGSVTVIAFMVSVLLSGGLPEAIMLAVLTFLAVSILYIPPRAFYREYRLRRRGERDPSARGRFSDMFQYELLTTFCWGFAAAMAVGVIVSSSLGFVLGLAVVLYLPLRIAYQFIWPAYTASGDSESDAGGPDTDLPTRELSRMSDE